MLIEVNGHKGDGTLVVPLNPNYTIKVTAKGDLDLFTITTCHREISLEDAWNKGIFSDKRKLEFVFEEGDLEISKYCPIHLTGFEKVKGRHSWAIIDISNEENGERAHIRCNGIDHAMEGVSICQSKEGLLQEIAFPLPVQVMIPSGCARMETEDNLKFRYKISPKECVYVFMSEFKTVHRLTTIGYESILVRGD